MVATKPPPTIIKSPKSAQRPAPIKQRAAIIVTPVGLVISIFPLDRFAAMRRIVLTLGAIQAEKFFARIGLDKSQSPVWG
jgi:hypothetical protein